MSGARKLVEAYRPPNAELRGPDLQPRSSFLAVLVGGLGVDFIGTFIIVFVVALVWEIVGLTSGEDPGAYAGSLWFLAMSYAVGSFMTLAGGYVAARWARRRPVAHGLGAGMLSLVVGVPFFFLPGALEPLWLVAGGTALHLPLAATGGYLAARGVA
ncbi:MAG: hypothetical protein GY937_05570 [bacterium]|nr:hypothetical protein [bacterium]